MFSKFRNQILIVLIADELLMIHSYFLLLTLVFVLAFNILWIKDYKLISTLFKYLSRSLLKTKISRNSRNSKNSGKFCTFPVLLILECVINDFVVILNSKIPYLICLSVIYVYL